MACAFYDSDPETTTPASPPTLPPLSLPLDPAPSQDWTLVQLPTRLPVVAAKQTPPPHDWSDVATPPQTDTYDHALSQPGYLGKWKVYQSGKQVLELGGGATLTIHKGLCGGLTQQAVVVDDGTYTPLGAVGESYVVTPDFG